MHSSATTMKNGAEEIFLGTEIVKDPGLLECKHRGFQIQQMFRSMIELDFGKVGDRKCIIRRLLAGCGQYSKILFPVSLAWIGGIHCGKSPFSEREPSSIGVIEVLEVVCKTIWT